MCPPHNRDIVTASLTVVTNHATNSEHEPEHQHQAPEQREGIDHYERSESNKLHYSIDHWRLT
jgi:hypothetical protein